MTLLPWYKILPSLGSIIPMIDLIVVLLPAPFGPI